MTTPTPTERAQALAECNRLGELLVKAHAQYDVRPTPENFQNWNRALDEYSAANETYTKLVEQPKD